MKILVCITHVPDTTSRIAFKENNTKFDTNGIQFVIGPYDDFALARAVELKESIGAEVTVINVGGPESDPSLRKALAIGADDAIRVNANPTDSYFVARQIANVAKDKEFNLILMGRESSDYNGGQVHGMVGELLGLPSISPAIKLEIEEDKGVIVCEIEGGKEHLEVKLPLIAGCQEPIAEWKIPNMRGIMSARSKPLIVVEATDNEVSTLVERYELPPEKGEVRMVDPDNVEGLVSLLKNEAKVL